MLLKRVANILAAALGASLAVTPALAAAARLTIDAAGLKRTAVIVEHVPLKLARRPLVVVLHGENGNGARIRRRLALESTAHSNAPIFLYPDALHGQWSGPAGAGAARDVVMLRDMIGRLVGEGLVDRRRIYLVGASTGGEMALRAACVGLGEPIVGLATIDAVMPADLAATCAPTVQVAFLDIEKATGSHVASAGARITAARAAIEPTSSLASAARFAKLNACTAGPLPAPSEFNDPHLSQFASVEQYLGCKAPVERVWIVGGKKPASVNIRADRAQRPRRAGKIDADAGRLVWAFLKNLGA